MGKELDVETENVVYMEHDEQRSMQRIMALHGGASECEGYCGFIKVNETDEEFAERIGNIRAYSHEEYICRHGGSEPVIVSPEEWEDIVDGL